MILLQSKFKLLRLIETRFKIKQKRKNNTKPIDATWKAQQLILYGTHILATKILLWESPTSLSTAKRRKRKLCLDFLLILILSEFLVRVLIWNQHSKESNFLVVPCLRFSWQPKRNKIKEKQKKEFVPLRVWSQSARQQVSKALGRPGNKERSRKAVMVTLGCCETAVPRRFICFEKTRAWLVDYRFELKKIKK